MALALLLDHTDALCFESASGFATVRVSGGQSPYTLSWTNADGDVISTGVSARGLEAGVYTCTVTDFNGDTATANVTIEEPAYEAPLDDIGMSLCNIKKCFLPIASCKAGSLTYKYFVDLPSQGVGCECEQKKVIWLNNAVDILRGWYPEGTILVTGMEANFTIPYPTFSCPSPSAVVTATLISSIDGLLATYPATAFTSDFSADIASYFMTELNLLSGYYVIGSGSDIQINTCGSQYEDAVIVINITITDLAGCSVTSLTWTPTFDGGTYASESGENTTCETEEPCLTNAQVNTMIETMKQITSDCNIMELKAT